MKKILVLLIFSIVLVSCNSPVKGDSIKTEDGYSIRIIDGCEYIEVTYALGTQQGYYGITHKGNCKNHGN